jgi:hypothetical protein
MRLQTGSQLFENVTIPLLWGTRAVLQDREDRLSVIDLSGPSARVEIVGNNPAEGVSFKPLVSGFSILADDQTETYSFIADENRLTSTALNLPDVEIGRRSIRVGGNTFAGNMVSGFGVGIAVWERHFPMGWPNSWSRGG